jgi:inhibitor of KinA sporulation pathway (predicted exonuclease)
MVDKNQNYIALDLELNNAQDHSTPNPKIIQVGIAIGDYEMYQQGTLVSHHWYLNPEEPIYPFITELTGITDEDVTTKSVTHEVLLTQLTGFIQRYKPFVNPITWGGGDSTELKQEFIDRQIRFPLFGRRWVDVKTWYVLHMMTKGKRPAGGLRSAMGEFKMQFEGTPHRADDDALNTLRLFFKIMERQRKMYDMMELAKNES